jgi:hypothetical protein
VTRRAALVRLHEISRELDELSERRCGLWRAAGGTGEAAAEIGELSRRIERLWATYRWLHGALRNGCHEQIRVRARREEELEREVRRRAGAAAEHTRP